MSEHEIHVDPHDSYGKFVGVQIALIAVLLSVATIMAHRAHTDTILRANAVSDNWAHYQAKRIRAYQIEMNTSLIKLLAPNSTEVANTLKDYANQSARYEKDLGEIKSSAEDDQKAEDTAHHRASFFDLAEGILEIAVVMSSMYFVARKKLFPSFGLLAGLAGAAIVSLGFLIK